MLYGAIVANRSCTNALTSQYKQSPLPPPLPPRSETSENVAVTSPRVDFQFYVLRGREYEPHVGGITFGLLQPSIFIKWSNFVARRASGRARVRVCARPSVTPGARRRDVRARVRPSCIIQIALSLSVCAVITSADVFCHGAPRTVGQMA